MGWLELFPNGKVRHGVAAHSYHISIWLDAEGEKLSVQGLRPLRFEVMWLKEQDCSKIIEEFWQTGSGQSTLGDIIRKIACCRDQLKLWNNSILDNVHLNLQKAKEKLSRLQNERWLQVSAEDISGARNDVHKWLEMEEMMWRQRSWVDWLKEGNKNIKYFHAKASTRR